jgi:hypothetical protein
MPPRWSVLSSGGPGAVWGSPHPHPKPQPAQSISGEWGSWGWGSRKKENGGRNFLEKDQVQGGGACEWGWKERGTPP